MTETLDLGREAMDMALNTPQSVDVPCGQTTCDVLGTGAADGRRANGKPTGHIVTSLAKDSDVTMKPQRRRATRSLRCS